MKKIILILFSTMVASCATMEKYQQPNGELITSNTEYPTVAIIVTQTPEPTIDYKSTAEIAQQIADEAQATADEARRMNAMATVEWVKAVNEQVAFTAEVDRQNFERESWTATAANLYVPMTATQQAINNTQIPAQQAIISGMMTSTKEAPTQLVAMIQAQNYQHYGKMDYIVRMFLMSATGIFVIGIIIFIFRTPIKHEQCTYQLQELQAETVIMHKQDKGAGNFSLTRFVVPCSPEQLTELAEAITQGEKTLAINQWEGKGTLFTRDVILRVRAWLRDEKQHSEIVFVTPTEDGQLAPTGELFDFLCGWLETKKLPTEYEFTQQPEKQVVDLNLQPL